MIKNCLKRQMPKAKRVNMPQKTTTIKIGVTGSIGSGKSLVCERFKKIGLAVLDCDVIARQVVEPGEKGLEQLVDQFGVKILAANGSLDRKQLRQILIQDENQKSVIEHILHPLIQERMSQLMQDALEPPSINNDAKTAVAVEVPLLFESNMDRLFDVTIAVVADEDRMVERVGQRDQVSVQNAKKLLNLQMPQLKKAEQADYIIENKGSRAQLFDLVDKLFDKIQKEFLTI